MTEALELTGNESVFEIGTGSGYQCAVLCELARGLSASNVIRNFRLRPAPH